tara:strand:+ start:336 stop:620 length:285 start_codon:yes stop_codon:yes gene_type:complete
MTKEIDLMKIAREQFPDTIVVDDMDEAIIGLSIRKPNTTNFVYSVNKIIKILMQDNATYHEAVEWYEYNIRPLEDMDKKHSPMFYDDRPHPSLN